MRAVAGDVTLYYQAWDVDFSSEVEILVNGNSVGFASTTVNETWGSTQVIVLPDGYVNDSSENLLTFTNTYNPPRTYQWGVRNVLFLKSAWTVSRYPIPEPTGE